mmetsp:Transcript_23177/g.26832  ORF Transcript_23177/g.26832 Transcript_23177/m.26832 type:complete len:97 (-) Transcript_23177:16-306(-)
MPYFFFDMQSVVGNFQSTIFEYHLLREKSKLIELRRDICFSDSVRPLLLSLCTQSWKRRSLSHESRRITNVLYFSLYATRLLNFSIQTSSLFEARG